MLRRCSLFICVVHYIVSMYCFDTCRSVLRFGQHAKMNTYHETHRNHAIMFRKAQREHRTSHKSIGNHRKTQKNRERHRNIC